MYLHISHNVLYLTQYINKIYKLSYQYCNKILYNYCKIILNVCAIDYEMNIYPDISHVSFKTPNLIHNCIILHIHFRMFYDAFKCIYIYVFPSLFYY